MAQDSNYVTVDGEFDSLEKRSFLTMDDYQLGGQNVILRIDINSSINPENGDLLDDTRIKRHSATVKELSDKNARLIILAHQSSLWNYSRWRGYCSTYTSIASLFSSCRSY